jgi:hypothetical protein
VPLACPRSDLTEDKVSSEFAAVEAYLGNYIVDSVFRSADDGGAE